MDGSKSVVTIKEYGRISIHLKEIMDSKGITRNYLARVSNTRFKALQGTISQGFPILALRSSISGTMVLWRKWIWIFSPVSAMYWNVRLLI